MNTRIHQARWLWGLAELGVFVESRELTESYVSKTFLGAWMRPNTLAAAGFTASLVTVSYLLSGTDLFPRATSKSCRFWHMLSQNIAAAWTSHHQQPFETLVQNKWHSVDLSTQPSLSCFWFHPGYDIRRKSVWRYSSSVPACNPLRLITGTVPNTACYKFESNQLGSHCRLLQVQHIWRACSYRLRFRPPCLFLPKPRSA